MHSTFIRWVTAAVVALSLLGGVGVAQAATLTPTQVAAIVNLLQSFGASASVVANVQATLEGQPTTSTAPSCMTFTGNLYPGLTDGVTSNQVSQLQAFLGVEQTGYFGALTEQAVETWQAAHNVVSSGSPSTTGYGSVGPTTRRIMGCGSTATVPPTQTQNADFSATPTSGTFPLTVTFSALRVWGINSGTINFGDGSSGILTQTACTQAAVAAAPATCPYTTTHTYIVPGTYTAMLYNGPELSLPQTGNVPATNYSDQLGTATITIAGAVTPASSAAITQSSLTTNSGNPTITGTASGTLSLTVTILSSTQQLLFGGLVPVINGQWSFTPSASNIAANIWSGSTTALPFPDSYTVSVSNNGTTLTSGTLNIGSTGSSPSNSMSLEIVPVSGSDMTTVPRTMAVTAVYPVAACANPNDTASYTLNFGDGSTESLSYSNFAIATDGPGGCVAEWTGANHSYTAAGTYTATLYRNGTAITTQPIAISL